MRTRPKECEAVERGAVGRGAAQTCEERVATEAADAAAGLRPQGNETRYGGRLAGREQRGFRGQAVVEIIFRGKEPAAAERRRDPGPDLLEEPLDNWLRNGWQGVEAGFASRISGEDSIENQGMEMEIEVQCGTKPLDEADRPRLGVRVALARGLRSDMSQKRAHEHATDQSADSPVIGGAKPQ